MLQHSTNKHAETNCVYLYLIVQTLLPGWKPVITTPPQSTRIIEVDQSFENKKQVKIAFSKFSCWLWQTLHSRQYFVNVWAINAANYAG